MEVREGELTENELSKIIVDVVLKFIDAGWNKESCE